jgi:hypothetical protein
LSCFPKSSDWARSCIPALALLACLAWVTADAAPSPTTEFDIPYQLRVESDSAVLEVSGSFSWALPQNVQAVLAAAPQVRVVRLESPGGHVLPAIQTANIIQQHGLDTYVGRLCASACTIAFLGGRQRWLAPGARLGFHQAHAPGLPAEQVNEYLRAAYETFHVPPSFVSHVLRTPAIDLWFPTPAELRAVHYTTGDPPDSVLAADHGWPPRLSDFAQRLWTAPDEAALQFGTALSDLLVLLQAKNPEACWAFAHEGPDAPQAALPPIALDALAAAGKYLPNVPTKPRDKTADAEQSKKAAAELTAFIREKGMVQAMQGLRPGADHAVFCPSLHGLLQAALSRPDPRRAGAVRAVLSPGGRQM